MPPTPTINARLPQDLVAWIDETDHFENRTGRLVQILERYREMVRRDLPKFSESEMNLIRDALNGVWMSDLHSPSYVWAEVADACSLNKADAKWGVDAKAIVDKLRGLTYGQTVALVEDVTRWWKEK